nr:Tat pathway signal protein [Burkholderiaceae bacterium]
MNPRRRFLNHAGSLSAASTLSMLGAALGTGLSRDAAAADYKTLDCVFLTGGNDGNDSLVPTDAAYNDYARARPGLA